jgi:N-acetylglucosaminyldiphosphoundecaprenol N-acetyl-beta-D-mannosaminyltransferase
MRTSVLGVPIDDFSLEEVLEKVKNGQRVFQVFVNVHKLVLFHEDLRFSAVLNAKDSVFAVDGKWIEFFARLKGFSPKERFGGQEVVNKCFAIAQEKGYKVYLLGAAKPVLEHVKESLSRAFPKATIVGAQDGFFDKEEEIIEDISQKQSDVLFLALPSPLKELLGYKIFDRVKSLKYVAGVGGAFDIIAGRAQRAPSWIQKFGFEWLWRVLREPKRLFKRYFFDGLWLCRLMLRQAFRYD